MKKAWLIIGICSISALTACQNDTAKNNLSEDSGNTTNMMNDSRPELYNKVSNKNVSENFGYVRHQKNPILGERVSNNQYAAMDREKLADIISKNCTTLPNVQDVSTLVTDEEVLIVYDTNTNDRNLTADQVKKTAMAFVPRWFHVYVSDNINLRKNVESYSQLDSNSKHAEYGINKVIKEMLKSPQGEEIQTQENANGESKGDKNNQMGK